MVDDGNRGDFECAGVEPFTYQGKTKLVRMSSYQTPEAMFDDAERLADWAANAMTAALRTKETMQSARWHQANTSWPTGAHRA